MLTSGLLEYFRLYRRTEKPTYDKEFFRIANDLFKNALSGASWFLYVTAVLLIASCLYYCYFERKDRRQHIQRVREIQNLIARAPPKRRPGAVAREREVFQNVLKTAHSYIYQKNDKKACVVRQTRSGTIYGQFLDDKMTDVDGKNTK